MFFRLNFECEATRLCLIFLQQFPRHSIDTLQREEKKLLYPHSLQSLYRLTVFNFLGSNVVCAEYVLTAFVVIGHFTPSAHASVPKPPYHTISCPLISAEMRVLSLSASKLGVKSKSNVQSLPPRRTHLSGLSHGDTLTPLTVHCVSSEIFAFKIFMYG